MQSEHIPALGSMHARSVTVWRHYGDNKPCWSSCRLQRHERRETEGQRAAGETEGDARQWSCCPRVSIPPSPCPCVPATRHCGDGGGSGAAGCRPVGGLIAVGWRGICCSLATNCCWNMIKWPLPANMWSCHGCLPVCLTDCLTAPDLYVVSPAFLPQWLNVLYYVTSPTSWVPVYLAYWISNVFVLHPNLCCSVFYLSACPAVLWSYSLLDPSLC